MFVPDDIPIPEDLEYALDLEPGTTCLVLGSPGGEPRVGMVLKRTYRYDSDGKPAPAPDDDQDLVSDEELVYEPLDPPLVSPVLFDDDTRAFRKKTDLVIQGHAYTYRDGVTQTKVSLRLGELFREIVVHGDRELMLGRGGQVEFGPAKTFESMPLRYDRAYGGVDQAALSRFHSSEIEDLKFARPELELGSATIFHYARNPSGRGFLIEADEESLRLARVPNLEYEFDPVTADRLAIGAPENWLAAPLPAAWDWLALDWFPRVAWLGLADWPEEEGASALPVKEIDRGWASADLRRIEPWLLDAEQPMRPEIFQASSPGLALEEIPAGEPLRLTGLHPGRPELLWHLPAETPQVVIELGGRQLDLQPHLNAVVVRPHLDEVVMIWCVHAPGEPKYTARQLKSIKQEIEWKS